MFQYKCFEKANSANSRSEQKISATEVYKVLQVCSKKCVYCQSKLHPNDWHLDHFTSLSTGGKNIFENLVGSCSRCNLMKGSLDGWQFYSKCLSIVANFIYKGAMTKNIENE